MSDIRSQIIELTAQLTGINKNDIENSDDLSSLGLDSLEVIDFINQVEGHFNVNIPASMLENINSMNDVIHAVESCL